MSRELVTLALEDPGVVSNVCYVSTRSYSCLHREHCARMGGWDVFRIGNCLSIALILSCISLSIEGQSIPGFVSIDCGAVSHNDTVTTIPWEGDSKYTSTGLNGQVPFPVDSSIDNWEALQTFRYFPGSRSKHCYELPTASNSTFLLRATFYQGSAPELTLPIQFDVAVNGTTVSTVQYTTSASYDTLSSPIELEGLFFSTGTLIHVCLVRYAGVPFISSLELRQLSPDGGMYSVNGTLEGAPTAGAVYLSNMRRFNFGPKIGSATLRYPDDPYDRLWKTPGSWSASLDTLDSTGVVQPTTRSTVNNVPPKVMQDAWVNSEPNTSFWFNFAFPSTVTAVYAAVYMEEITPGAVAGDRMFSINLNGDLTNITNVTGKAHMLRYSSWAVLQSNTNFTFTALPTSLLGPIVNAVEVYGVNTFNYSATAAKDVDALAALQVSFNLTDWQGDPCYPVPWDWVSCTSDVTARVDKLLLSSVGIHASIPPTISNLDALTEIRLNNNSLYGSIPDSLASLPYLVLLFLNDNNLSGEVPTALLTKLATNQFLYSGNSLLGAQTSPTSASKKSANIGVIIGAVAGGVLVVGIVIGVVLWYYLSKKRQNKEEISISCKPPSVLQSTQVGRVSYETLKIATNDFSVKIGQGSYGPVFHGRLDNTEVAVKLNNVQSSQGRNEFLTEVDILTRVHHRNLVSLIAYCDEGQQLILVYEYQSNGTLREWLRGKTADDRKTRGTLDWKKRLQIAADAAKGLEYLHKGCDPTIIHRDVKSNNILLDINMTAKVADFGLSKSTTGENSVGYSTAVKGTPGYLDPEYHQLGKLTYKSDVYSYGVVLAEIITGLPPFSDYSTDKSSLILVDRVRKLVARNDIEALADPQLQGEYNPESMWRMADVALACIDPDGATRPDFTQVLNDINEAIVLEKTMRLHSPIAPQSRSFMVRSDSSNGYQSLP